MRHVTFRGVQNLEVVLPEGWWQRGGIWVGYNEVRARKCKRLLRERMMTDGEDEEREMRLVFCLEEVFDKVVNL
jgi:hypothetical protein